MTQVKLHLHFRQGFSRTVPFENIYEAYEYARNRVSFAAIEYMNLETEPGSLRALWNRLWTPASKEAGLTVPDDRIGDVFEPMPEWAIRPAYGRFSEMASLPTKDGRRVGNAVLFTWTVSHFTGDPLAVVVSDAGNILKCSQRELEELFHPPEYIMSNLLPAHSKAMDELFESPDP